MIFPGLFQGFVENPMDIFNCLSGKAPASIFFRPRELMIKLLNIICDQALELYRTHAWNDVHFRLLAIEQGSRRFHVSLVICQPIIQPLAYGYFRGLNVCSLVNLRLDFASFL